MLERGQLEDTGRAARRRSDGGWTTVTGIARDLVPDLVPDLVAALVAAGGRVEAVVPEHPTLEQRFLELLERP